jgi:PAS domain S-box-containing protein
LIRGYNPAAGELFGYSSKEILGHSIFQLIPLAAKVKPPSGIDLEMNIFAPQVEARRKDGTNAPVSLQIAQTMVNYKLRFWLLIEDLTARRGQEQMQMHSQLLWTALDSAGLMVAVLNPQGGIIHLSRMCSDLLGVSSPFANGRPFWEVFQRTEDWSSARACFERAKKRSCAGPTESRMGQPNAEQDPA